MPRKSVSDDDDPFLPLPLQIAHDLMSQLSAHPAKYVQKIAADFSRLAGGMKPPTDGDGKGLPD